tara:strand:+ start:873 stop:1805 length:933 start_codon:yes stop_codon:yes gene_type:complete
MIDNQEENQGNPQIGMQGDSFESMENDNAVPDSISGSEDFFNELENTVNSGIQDNTEATQQDSSPEQVTYNNQQVGSDNVETVQSDNSIDWEKRYKDSSREAVKWREQYKEVEAFVPVLQAMKKDGGLVEHVRDYLVNGGKPAQSIQEKLQLNEDFVFDQQEAMSNPDSDSAKLMNAHVDGMVQNRVSQMLKAEQQRAMQTQQIRARKQEEEAFKKKNNMSDEQFEQFKEAAKKHTMSLDDINYLLNRDKTNANVANATKQDMLDQMKNVRNMPTSASGANSQSNETKTVDRDVFDSILGFDNNVDNLFG